jgi:predicted RNA-binding Zn ribbon-like protein
MAADREWHMEERDGAFAVVDERGVALAKFEPAQLLDCEVTPAEAQSAAELAAAAPDLREALGSMVVAFKRRKPLSTAMANKLLAQCEASLAKAEGRP